MKAVVVKELKNRESVGLSDMPEPEAGPGEVLVDVKAASVNFPDVLMLDGKYQIRPDPPFILGKDAAGTVKAVGDGVTRVKPGDRVVLYIEYGAFAQVVKAPETQVFPIPDNLDFESAAAMGLVYQTVWVALMDRGQMQPGETVLVTGASGGVGMAAMDLAKACGAGKVLAGLTTMSKADAVREAGADDIIDLSGDDLRDGIRAQVKEKAGGGVDVVIDVVGGDVFDGALRSLNQGGRIVVVGFTGGRIPEVKTNYLLLKHISVVGSSINSIYNPAGPYIAGVQEKLNALIADGKLTARIMARHPAADVGKALSAVENREVIGKVVITF